MTGFWEKRRKIKLYNQWIRQGELRPEDIPEELQPGKKKPEEGDHGGNPAEGSDNGRNEKINEKINGKVGLDSKTVYLPIRYILYIGLLIVLLTVALSVVFTILVLRSC